jgi:hypothetical protein
MKEQIEALTEVTLAIARASTKSDAAFSDALEANLRDALLRRSADPLVFDQTFRWLERFESEESEV